LRKSKLIKRNGRHWKGTQLLKSHWALGKGRSHIWGRKGAINEKRLTSLGASGKEWPLAQSSRRDLFLEEGKAIRKKTARPTRAKGWDFLVGGGRETGEKGEKSGEARSAGQ